MKQVSPDRLPPLTDDLDQDSLVAAIGHSIQYLEKLPPERSFVFAGTSCSAAWLAESLTSFLKLLESAPDNDALFKGIAGQFLVFRARGSGLFGRILVTGYYEPILDGSLTEKYPYIYPLYRVPPDLVVRTAADGTKETGRLVDNELVPYWSRAEIEEKNLLAGLEMVYLADPVDAFILHVQGSGKIRLRDGSLRGILFAGKNGLPYRSIGRLLVDQGRMKLAEVSMPGIRSYLAAHPEELTKILHHNPSFIFFRWDPGTGLVGNLGAPLTAGRSIAADQKIYPAGALGFLKSRKPRLDASGKIREWIPLSRFVLVQDSGSAIKGPGRLDLFWGNTDYARTAAGAMQHKGEFYLLVKKRP
ncbi:MAG: MltA domain-containing protein [Desulfobacterales bacterium]|nr:MltA domain-containing protein [Desulfobacterales bacterium]